jgi:hypothetical protein
MHVHLCCGLSDWISCWQVDKASLDAKLRAGVEIKCGKVSGRVVHSCAYAPEGAEEGGERFHVSRWAFSIRLLDLLPRALFRGTNIRPVHIFASATSAAGSVEAPKLIFQRMGQRHRAW